MCFFQFAIIASAQKPNVLRSIGNRVQGIGNQQGNNSGPDSVRARNLFEDSVTVSIYYIDSTRAYRLDTSINDFTRRFPIPPTHLFLGNTGSASRSLLFSPQLKAGWDPGFHAFDVYKWQIDKLRFYNTTRPYTEIGYVLGPRAEQIVEVFHSQNIKPYWNFGANYRLIAAPGVFRNQRNNHNSYSFTSRYQSPNKRYGNYFALLGNRLQATESGGIKNDEDYLNDIRYARDRFLIPSNIGGEPVNRPNVFTNEMATGNRYREFNILLRQQYDLGRKDSLVTDSTVIPLFFPRLRFEHTLKYGRYQYSFRDFKAFTTNLGNTPDSAWYWNNYGLSIPQSDSLLFYDNWKEISNDFSIYQFPDAKNLHQYIKLGAELQLLRGNFFSDSVSKGSASLSNVIAHGEYRNLTKNRKWDLFAFGRLWLAGYNLGDYHAYISLQRLSSKIGSFQIGFENVNRSPWFNYDQRSGFYLDVPKSFNKENTTHLFASVQLQKLRLQLSADYFLIGNYLYLTNFKNLQQENSVFNVLRINAVKTFRIGRRWNVHSEVYIQQKAGNAEVNFPLLYTRNRLMYEGNFGFRNLNIAFGAETRYHTPYKADNYSPVRGQFFYQDSVTISNRPEVHLFVHFRIRTFKAYIRFENLNTARTLGGFQFNNNNLAAPGYPIPGGLVRFGIYWSFVN